jgi:hypothetical protein
MAVHSMGIVMEYFSINYSGNEKTGKMPVTSSDKKTCPDTCPLKGGNGCYAENHYINQQWDKLTDGTMKAATDYNGLLKAIKRLPNGMLWRMNEKGDLSHNNGTIDTDRLSAIVTANKGKQGFTYTHHALTDSNLQAIKTANNKGFTINLSANNAAQADDYLAHGLPVVTLLPVTAGKVSYTPQGNKIVACPAGYGGKVTCASCGLCAIPDRNYIIGFKAHGTRKSKVNIIAVG